MVTYYCKSNLIEVISMASVTTVQQIGGKNSCRRYGY